MPLNKLPENDIDSPHEGKDDDLDSFTRSNNHRGFYGFLSYCGIVPCLHF